LEVDTVSITSGRWSSEPFDADVVVRYRGVPHAARVRLDDAEARAATVTLPGEQGPIASPGQAVVFYRGDEVLGGGTIRRVERRGAVA
jgi:tRNA-specific 2-thiouridylase